MLAGGSKQAEERHAEGPKGRLAVPKRLNCEASAEVREDEDD